MLATVKLKVIIKTESQVPGDIKFYKVFSCDHPVTRPE